jgi:glycosyltransferase involved in cell wall biosynthesis
MSNPTLPKVTVITTVFNNREFIRNCVESVLLQSYPNIEYIVKDAGSTDGTLEMLSEYRGHLRVISQGDNGMYDGINQALEVASGDIISILNSDDFFTTPDAVAHMVRTMQITAADIGWGDINYIKRIPARALDESRRRPKVIRKWHSSPYSVGKFKRGWHPPHPALFVRRYVYEKYGFFRTDIEVAADYELMLRFLERHHIESCYLPETIVTMRSGGASGNKWDRVWKIRREDAYAWKVNKLDGGFFVAWVLKPLSKISQLFK